MLRRFLEVVSCKNWSIYDGNIDFWVQRRRRRTRYSIFEAFFVPFLAPFFIFPLVNLTFFRSKLSPWFTTFFSRSRAHSLKMVRGLARAKAHQPSNISHYSGLDFDPWFAPYFGIYFDPYVGSFFGTFFAPYLVPYFGPYVWHLFLALIYLIFHRAEKWYFCKR